MGKIKPTPAILFLVNFLDYAIDETGRIFADYDACIELASDDSYEKIANDYLIKLNEIENMKRLKEIEFRKQLKEIGVRYYEVKDAQDEEGTNIWVNGFVSGIEYIFKVAPMFKLSIEVLIKKENEG